MFLYFGYDMSDDIITREEIEKIALHDPVVHAMVVMYKKGLLSWEESMMECVKVLVNRSNGFQEALNKEIMNRPANFRFIE